MRSFPKAITRIIVVMILGILSSKKLNAIDEAKTLSEKIDEPAEIKSELREFLEKRWAGKDPGRADVVARWKKAVRSEEARMCRGTMRRMIDGYSFQSAIMIEWYGGADIGSSFSIAFVGKLQDGRILILVDAIPSPTVEGVVWPQQNVKANPVAEMFDPLIESLMTQSDFYTDGIVGSPRQWNMMAVRVFQGAKSHQCFLSSAEDVMTRPLSKDESKIAKLCTSICDLTTEGESLRKVEFDLKSETK
jgi:hypothetical protein